MKTSEQIVAVARSYVGTPFVHQGRVKGKALDCVGLVICTARELGIAAWRDGSSTGKDFVYGAQLAQSELLALCRQKLMEKPLTELAPGDVVVISAPTIPGHIGIVGRHNHGLRDGYKTLIHAVNTHRALCVEHILTLDWEKSIVACFAFPLAASIQIELSTEPEVKDQARLAITIGAAVIGGLLALPTGGISVALGMQLGALAGSIIGSFLFPGHIEGPHLADGRMLSTTYGTPIPIGWGRASIGGQVIHDSGLKEHKHEDGGSGTPTVTTYTYSVTMALAFGKGFGRIRRMWADGKCIFDSTGVSDVSAAQGWKIRIHGGTETQLPDSALEAIWGVGNVPAYRGLIYCVLDDVPLDNFGQHRPSMIKAEIAYGAQLSVTIAKILGGGTGILDLAGLSAAEYDVTQVSGIVDGFVLANVSTARQAIEALSRAFLFAGVESDFQLKFISQAARAPGVTGITPPGGRVWAIQVFNHYAYIASDAELQQVDGITDTVGAAVAGVGSGGISAWSMFLDQAGLFYIGEAAPALRAAPWHRYDPTVPLKTADYGEAAFGFAGTLGELPPSDYGGGAVAEDAAGNRVAIVGFGEVAELGCILLYAPDVSTLPLQGVAINDDTSFTGTKRIVPGNSGLLAQPCREPVVDSDGRIWVAVRKSNNLKLTSIDPVDPAGITGPDGSGYYHYNFVLTVYDLGTQTTWEHSSLFYSPKLRALLMSFAGVTKAWSIDTHVFTGLTGAFPLDAWSNLDQGYFVTKSATPNHVLIINAADLTILQDVDGTTGIYQIPSGMGNFARIGFDLTLRAIWVVGNDLKLYHITVGGALLATGFTIDQDDLLAESKEKPVRLTETRTQELELPAKVTVRYSDLARNYDPSAQAATRHNTVLSADEVEMQVPVTSTADRMKQAAERVLYTLWAQRDNKSFKTLPKHLLLDPLDIGQLNYKGTGFALRLVKQNDGADGSIEFAAVNNENAFDIHYSQTSGSQGSGALQAPVIQAHPATDLLILDVPLLRDADANDAIAGCYWTVKPHAAGDWSGAALYSSPDGSSFDQEIGTSVTQPTWGTVALALPTFPANPWDRDDTNTIVVALQNGSLASVTDADVEAGKNWCVLGNEVLAFTTAVDNLDGTWTLSHLYRGLRGTEWAAPAHAINEKLVMVDFTPVKRAAASVTLIGVTRYYRAVTYYTTIDSASNVAFATSGRDLKPYAPYLIGADQSPSGDIEVTWSRRTRYGGKWNGYTQGLTFVPLSEAFEAYEIDIMSGVTVKRTLKSNSPLVWYSKAQQIADFGSQQSAVTVNVYQMSVLVGRGFQGHAVISSFAGVITNQPGSGALVSLVISGAVNGVNTVYTLDRTVSVLLLFIDGQKVNSADITITGGGTGFTLSFAPPIGANLEALGS